MAGRVAPNRPRAIRSATGMGTTAADTLRLADPGLLSSSRRTIAGAYRDRNPRPPFVVRPALGGPWSSVLLALEAQHEQVVGEHWTM